jgi:NAD+ synthase
LNEQLEEIKNQDYALITKKIEDFLKTQVEKSNSNGIILGLSGGIDSSVITYLCSRVLKEKTLALVMPDSKISPKEETEDALKIIAKLGIAYKLLDINQIVSEYSKYLEPNERALGNLRARVRANILYYYANSKNLLVVGSSDKSEFLIGYFTKFGDGSADILPIVSLEKTQIREIAKFLGVPKNIIEKKSSPYLWKGHNAEEEIGVRYEEIDSILFCIFDKKLSIEDTVQATGIEKSVVEKINNLYNTSVHKRITSEKP